MFGIVRPCRHRLTDGMRADWMAHLCGLCLALRGECGQFARVATNYDGLIISVLTEAQSERTGGDRRSAGPCLLRRMHGASVAQGDGARLAATVSLVLASAKMQDHVADKDGLLGSRPLAAAASRVAGNWGRAGAQSGDRLGFDAGVLLEAVERQPDIERVTLYGSSLLAVTEPTETATGAAFAHTAVLAGMPGNTGPLGEAGRLFGRLAHLLDAVEDLAEDADNGAWNPVAVTGVGRTEVRRLCDDAVHGIRLALQEAAFTDDRLVRTLLGPELERAVRRAFRTVHGHGRGTGKAGSRSPLRLSPAGRRTKSGSAKARRAGAGCAVAAFLGGGQPGEGRHADGSRPAVAQSEGWCPGCSQWRPLCEDCGDCGDCRTCQSDDETEPVESGGDGGGDGSDGSDGSGGGSGGGPGGPGSEASGDDGGCCDCDCCDCDCCDCDCGCG